MAQITLNSTGVASNGALTLQSNGTTTAISIGTNQNVNFPVSAQRITGDFTNATVANRVLFQTSTANSGTGVAIIPNGTSANASISVFGASDPTNCAAATISTDNNNMFVISGINGTGTYVPMRFFTNGSERARIDTSGNFLVGTTSSTPTAPFTGLLVAGLFKTISTSGVVTNASSATLFTITVDTAYLVTVQTGNASGLSTTALVRYVSGGNPVATTTVAGDSASFVVSVSGTAVRITNNLGGSVNYVHNSVRIF